MTCCKGYRVLSDGCNAPADARNAARRLRIEYSVLEVWGMHWQIGNDPQQARGKKRFEDYLMRPHVLDGVFDALCAISETFTDIADLNKKYGVVFTYQAKADKVSPHALTADFSMTSCSLAVEPSHTSRNPKPIRWKRD